ncbi:hypothetical protein VB773_01950 [Haloarculaceae archaeon H-GB2-1]|nr:hypothetical protein [Haloarculaceae archaeon H-GB1-1]MEA5388430.1 hypothetical protein [Haloarculaceae archaeon H-GB11]MEA5406465.1 hypothetical protein [Haloarculaceae archaeon H-GB2-1]
MSEDPEPFENPIVLFGMGTIAVALSAVPALATVATATGLSVSPSHLALVAGFVGVAGGVETASSARDAQRLGRYAVALNALWLVSGLAVVGVATALGATQSQRAVELSLVAVAYVLAYALVYGGLLERLRAAV